MQRFIQLFPLLLIFAFVRCNWTEPLLLTEEPHMKPGFYVDNSTGNAYFFYGKTVEKDNNIYSYVCFKVVSIRKTVIKDACLRQKIRIIDVAATGKDNGKELYVTFSAARALRGEQCNRDVHAGCVDIYFIESTDGGETWSQPVAIPRMNMDDSIDRKSPSILFVKETKRLFIFFFKPDDHKILYASRAKDSVVFNNERDIYQYEDRSDPINTAKFMYTSTSGIALRIILKDKDIMSIISNDNGINWVTNKMFKDDYSLSYSVAQSLYDDYIYLTLTVRDKTYIQYFSENKWWSHRVLPFKSGRSPGTILLGSVPGKPNLTLMMGFLFWTDYSTSLYDYETEDIIDEGISPSTELLANAVIRKVDKYAEALVVHKSETGTYLSTFLLKVY